MLDLQVGGSSQFAVSNTGVITAASLVSGGSQCLQASSSGVISGTGSVCGGGSVALSSITPATGSNSINNGANSQTWAWDSLTTGTGFTVSSSSLSSGTLQSISVNSTAAASSTRFAFSYVFPDSPTAAAALSRVWPLFGSGKFPEPKFGFPSVVLPFACVAALRSAALGFSRAAIRSARATASVMTSGSRPPVRHVHRCRPRLLRGGLGCRFGCGRPGWLCDSGRLRVRGRNALRPA